MGGEQGYMKCGLPSEQTGMKLVSLAEGEQEHSRQKGQKKHFPTLKLHEHSM